MKNQEVVLILDRVKHEILRVSREPHSNPWEALGPVLPTYGQGKFSQSADWTAVANFVSEALKSLPALSLQSLAEANPHIFNDEVFKLLCERGGWNADPEEFAIKLVMGDIYPRRVETKIAWVGAGTGHGTDKLSAQLSLDGGDVLDLFDFIPWKDSKRQVTVMQGGGQPLRDGDYDVVMAPSVYGNADPRSLALDVTTLLISGAAGCTVVITDTFNRTKATSVLNEMLAHVALDLDLRVCQTLKERVICLTITMERALSREEVDICLENWLKNHLQRTCNLDFGRASDDVVRLGQSEKFQKLQKLRLFTEGTTAQTPVVYAVVTVRTDILSSQHVYIGAGGDGTRALAHINGIGSRVVASNLAGLSASEVPKSTELCKLWCPGDLPDELWFKLMGSDDLTLDQLRFVMHILEGRFIRDISIAGGNIKLLMDNLTESAHGHRAGVASTREDLKETFGGRSDIIGDGGGFGDAWLSKDQLQAQVASGQRPATDLNIAGGLGDEWLSKDELQQQVDIGDRSSSTLNSGGGLGDLWLNRDQLQAQVASGQRPATDLNINGGVGDAWLTRQQTEQGQHDGTISKKGLLTGTQSNKMKELLRAGRQIEEALELSRVVCMGADGVRTEYPDQIRVLNAYPAMNVGQLSAALKNNGSLIGIQVRYKHNLEEHPFLNPKNAPKAVPQNHGAIEAFKLTGSFSNRTEVVSGPYKNAPEAWEKMVKGDTPNKKPFSVGVCTAIKNGKMYFGYFWRKVDNKRKLGDNSSSGGSGVGPNTQVIDLTGSDDEMDTEDPDEQQVNSKKAKL